MKGPIRRLLMGGAALALLLSTPGVAQSWEPTEEIELVTHSTTGSSIDLFLRTIAKIWQDENLVPVTVSIQNRTGSRGDRARRYVVNDNADNAHLLFGWTPSQLNNPILMKSRINVESFTPIALAAVSPIAMIVKADSPYKSLDDVIQASKKDPGKVLHGGGAFGTVSSLSGILLGEKAGTEFIYVPYDGGGEAVVQLLGGHIDFVLENPAQVAEHVKAGKLRPLAVSETLDIWPDVPTFRDEGYDFQILAQYRGLQAPPKIPAEVQDYYIQLLDKTRQTEAWKKYLEDNGLLAMWVTGDEMRTFLKKEEDAYRRLNKDLGLIK